MSGLRHREHRVAAHHSHWMDAEVADPRCKLLEDQVEMRMHSKRMCDCALPEGFRLLHPQARMHQIDKQLRWAFCLVFTSLHHGEFFFPFRYEVAILDEMQLAWALTDFIAELQSEGMAMDAKVRRAA